MRENQGGGKDSVDRFDPIPQLFLRLQRTLEFENECLRTRSVVDASEHIARKNHALLELQRVIGGLSSQELAERAGERIQALREAVKTNAEILSRQLEAVREVSEILRNAIHMSDSDGTYSVHHATRGRAK
ncbi:MAG: hypothetical protein APF80_01845 [Alphaproteobacteria bacterium BRH_c36]|nr:MAG: hypothetical protein APF80_01845 [Alphaproteobacteria bacterium BRH_c36]